MDWSVSVTLAAKDASDAADARQLDPAAASKQALGYAGAKQCDAVSGEENLARSLQILMSPLGGEQGRKQQRPPSLSDVALQEDDRPGSALVERQVRGNGSVGSSKS